MEASPVQWQRRGFSMISDYFGEVHHGHLSDMCFKGLTIRNQLPVQRAICCAIHANGGVRIDSCFAAAWQLEANLQMGGRCSAPMYMANLCFSSRTSDIVIIAFW